MASLSTEGAVITLRLPAAIDAEIRRLADRDFETKSSTIRRLLRSAIEREKAVTATAGTPEPRR